MGEKQENLTTTISEINRESTEKTEDSTTKMESQEMSEKEIIDQYKQLVQKHLINKDQLKKIAETMRTEGLSLSLDSDKVKEIKKENPTKGALAETIRTEMLSISKELKESNKNVRDYEKKPGMEKFKQKFENIWFSRIEE